MTGSLEAHRLKAYFFRWPDSKAKSDPEFFMLFVARPPRQGGLIFLLLVTGSICMSSLIPVMGFFIIEGLGEPAWKVGFYTGIALPLSMLINRWFGEKLDQGVRVRRLLLVSVSAFICFCMVLASIPSFVLLVLLGAPLMSIANGSSSTTFTYGRLYAEQAGFDITRTNSWLRMGISLAWMIGPALAYVLIDQFGFMVTFAVSGAAGVLWLLLCFSCVPADYAGPQRSREKDKAEKTDWGMLLAALCCLFFAVSNTLFVSAMPLFFIREAALPGYAPGLSLSIKCFLEIFAIFASARLAQRFGVRGVIYAAAIAGTVTMVLFTQVSSVVGVVSYAALEGLYYGLFAGVAITFVQSFAPEKPGRATAIYMNSLFMGGMIGSVSMGFIATAFDFRTVLLFSAASLASAIVVLVFTRGAGNKQPVS